MNKYTVLVSIVGAATIAAVAFADLGLSHGQAVKAGTPANSISSLTGCGVTISRAERAPAGGVRMLTYKACPHANLLAAGTCPMDEGCAAKCAAK